MSRFKLFTYCVSLPIIIFSTLLGAIGSSLIDSGSWLVQTMRKIDKWNIQLSLKLFPEK